MAIVNQAQLSFTALHVQKVAPTKLIILYHLLLIQSQGYQCLFNFCIHGYVSVFDKVLWRTKWHRKVLCGPVLPSAWAMLAQSKIKLGQYCQW